MLLLDTCAFIYDALDPGRLSKRAASAIETDSKSKSLAISDITLWEVAMLVNKGRIRPGMDTEGFLRTALAARSITVLPITIEIASCSAALRIHGDPADRLIAATALIHHANLVTADKTLRSVKSLKTVW